MNEPSTKARTTPKRLAGILAVAAVFGGLVFMQSRTDGELRDLPEAERRALFARTQETLRVSCAQPLGPNLTEYCREQAVFIKRFPECDRSCRELADRFALWPSR